MLIGRMRDLAVTMMVLAAALSCGKRREREPTDGVGATNKPDAVASTPSPSAQSPIAPSARAGGHDTGAAARYLPADCQQGRAYVNAGSLLAIAGAEAAAVQEHFALVVDAKGNAKQALKTLLDGGIDPARDLREIAVCARGGDDVVIAFGVDLAQAKGDPLDLIIRAAQTQGETLEKRKAGTLEYVPVPKEQGGGVFARLSPSVIVTAKTPGLLEEAARGEGATRFSQAIRHLVFTDLAMAPDSRLNVRVLEGSDHLALSGEVTVTGTETSRMKKDPKAFLAEMQQRLGGIAKELESTAFKALAPDVRKAKLSMEGDLLRVEATAPKTRVRELFVAARSANSEDLGRLMR